jgi:poly(3-hydroxybutyrate) depolymerase
MRMRRVSIVSLLAAGALATTVSCSGSGDIKSTPTLGGAGADGTTGGAAGLTGSGSAGTEGSAAAGSGDTGTAGAGDPATGVAGSGAAGSSTGAAGTTTTGAGGSTTGAGGSATGAGGSSGPAGLAKGMSMGCGNPPPGGDKMGSFVKHNITVTGIASTVKAAQSPGSWTSRVYFLQLPNGYDPSKPYPVILGGGGCGGSINTNGSDGGFTVLQSSQSSAIQIGMSYVWPQGGGACFDDDGSDTPDLPYFDAIMAEVKANYCVDNTKVFVGGYSSGGWEAYMLGLARGGSVVRGISPAAGGLRMSRPTPSNLPIAALLLTGGDDTTNPATGSTGSDLAMALILQTNGCTGTATTAWPVTCNGCACLQYTGCPAAYPVVRCRPPGQGHTDGGGAFKTAIWNEWMSLP